MYLKSLVLKGFKSFADRSVLTLEPGLTVIVGPNGSGKSNISDAVLWVLGEQSARHLRGQAMEDVIFAGSSARKAVSLAEVDLVLDNSDDSLPLDFDEVAITRRMYRNGESEYLINGSPARLIDVLDILNDSGLGRDAHSIISQGSLQNVLHGKPEDRRALVEEAAGILKHKKRKERSARKMKSLDVELTRVNDIAREIDRQLKPLERQAHRAQQYDQLCSELKDIDLSLAVDDLRQLQRHWNTIDRQEKEADTVVELARFRMEEKKQALDKYQHLLEEKGLFVGDINEQRRRCQLVLQRLDSSMLLLEEKGRNMVSRLSELRQTIHHDNAHKTQAQSQLNAAKTERRDTIAKRKELYSQLSDYQHICETLRKKRKACDEDVNKMSTQIRARQRAVDDCQLKLMKANESLSTAGVQDGLLADRFEQIEESLVATQTTLSQRRARLEELESELAKLKRDSTLAKSDIDKRVRLLELAQKKLEDTRTKLADIRAEIKGIEEVDRAFDAASPMLSWVIVHADEVDGLDSPINEIFTIEPAYEKLVERILGADLFGLAMEDTHAAVELAAELSDEKFGSSGEISLVPKEGSHANLKRAARGKRLLDFVKYDTSHAHIAEVLLGDVYILDDLREAVNASKLDNSGSRFVTPTGIIVWPDGKITIGTQVSDTDGVLSRKRRLNALCDEEPQILEMTSEAELALEEAEHNLQLAQSDDFEISQQGAQLSGESDFLRQEIGRLEQAITKLMSEKDAIVLKRKKIYDDTATARQLAYDLEGRKTELEKQKNDLEDKLAEVTDKRDVLVEQVNTSAQTISDIQVELATVRERELHLEQRVSSLESELRQLKHSVKVSHGTEKSLEILRLRVEPLHESLTTLREAVTHTAGTLRERASLEQAGQGDLRSTIEHARGEVADAQAKLDNANESLTSVRIDKSKLEVRVEAAVKTITEDNGALLDLALELPAPQDRCADEARAQKLRKKIERIGSVNPVAVNEYRNLKERRDFITMQLEDLDGARHALQRIVRAIDRKMRNRFLETFETLNRNFTEIFAELFPGGHAHLELTMPNTPEETGVEVHAQPRGKAVRKQSLLSGGEQSLVALALLFATYRVRSTPFYILDEVEAALDDTNLRRLLAYLDGMRKHTQFILISHQRRTMEMADLLYGVSMCSDGVSKLVSQKLDQAMRYAHDVPALRDVEGFSGAQ